MDINVPRIFNFVALILLLVGAFTPGWFVFTISDDRTFQIGLFYAVGLGEANVRGLFGFLEMKIEIIISLILCFLATIFTCVYKTGQRGHSFLLAPILFNLFAEKKLTYMLLCIAGILACIAVGRFLYLLLPLYKLLSDSNDTKIPYSLILSGLGGILCFIVVIILCVKKREDSYLEAPPSSSLVVFTNVAQPQLNLGYGMQTQS